MHISFVQICYEHERSNLPESGSATANSRNGVVAGVKCVRLVHYRVTGRVTYFPCSVTHETDVCQITECNDGAGRN